MFAVNPTPIEDCGSGLLPEFWTRVNFVLLCYLSRGSHPSCQELWENACLLFCVSYYCFGLSRADLVVGMADPVVLFYRKELLRKVMVSHGVLSWALNDLCLNLICKENCILDWTDWTRI